MNKPSIVCFSHSKEHLDQLFSELHYYCGACYELSTFQKEDALLDSLKQNISVCHDTKLLVIDIIDCSVETIRFIECVNQSCPTAIKLIIAENHLLSPIKKLITRNSSIQFLNRPWTATEMNMALNLVSLANTNLQPTIKNNYEELIFKEKLEEKVNERLQKLIDSNRAKDSFLSIISHDLKSPFTALLGISEILLNDWEILSDKHKLELVGDLHKTSEDTYTLLLNLLEWAKSQKEKLEVTINEVRIHHLVDTTLKVTENNASIKGIKIQNKIDAGLKVQTDENMIATVFRNLISNAVQYTQPGGNINITAKEDKDFCTFCIADNGSGIDKPHILEFFNKGNRNRLNGNSSAFKGFGLIICKDFIEKNGGQIWLETQKGEGSKFFFTIPF